MRNDQRSQRISFADSEPQNNQPLLSIIIPISGSTENLRDAINSALIQSYSPLELIVCADASVDEKTKHVLAMYGSRLSCVFCNQTLTQGQLINKGVQLANGTLIAWLNKSQAWPVQLMASMVKTMDKHYDSLEAVVCGIDPCAFEEKDNKVLSLWKYLCADIEAGQKPFVCLTSKAAYQKAEGVNEQLNAAVNFDFILRLLEHKSSIAYLPSLDSGRLFYSLDVRDRWELDMVQSKWLRKLSKAEFAEYLKKAEQSPDKYLSTCIKKEYAQTYGEALRLAIGNDNCETAILNYFKQQLALSIKKSHNLEALPDIIHSQKPRIAFYVNVWRFGGIERVVSLLLNILQDKYSFVLITSEEAGKTSAAGFEIPKDTVHFVIEKTTRINTVQQLVHICSGLEIELFVGTPNIIESFLPIYERMKYMQIKTIASHHYFYYLTHMVNWSWLNRIGEIRNEMISHADLVTWPLEFSTCCGLDSHPNTVALPNPNTFLPMAPHPEKKQKIILVVGRFYDLIKRLDRALMVYKYVHALDSSIKMMLLGEYKGDMVFPLTNGQTLDNWLKNTQFPIEGVEFVGEKVNVVPYYEEASVLLMPSDCEGFGMSVTEAGVAGLPVVTSYYPGCDELVVEGENGYSFAPDDYQEAAKKIIDILHNNKRWKNMSIRAQELASRYTEEKVAQRYQKAFDCVLRAENSQSLNALLLEAGLLLDEQRQKAITAQRISYLEARLLNLMKNN